MLNKFLKPFILVAAILSSACAVVEHNHLDQAARPLLETVDSNLLVEQEEIYADINQSQTTAAMGGGILFALIDAAIDNSSTKKAEELLGPIRNGLLDYDFAEVLRKNIATKITDINWLNTESLELHRSKTDDYIKTSIDSSEASAVLFIDADYKLAPDFSSVITSASILMFPKEEALYAYRENPKGAEEIANVKNNIYRKKLSINVPIIGMSTKKAENSQALSDNIQLLINALEQSAKDISTEVAKGIALDENADT